MTTDASLAAAGTRAREGTGKGGWGDPAFAGIVRACGLVVLLLIGGIIAVMLAGGRQAFSAFGWGFLSSSAWNPVLDHYGALTAMFGTLVTAAIGLVVAVPLAFGVAFCLTEMAPSWLSGPLGIAVELLAAVPSIIFGMWGFFVIVPLMAHDVQPPLIHTLGRVPLLHPFFSRSAVRHRAAHRGPDPGGDGHAVHRRGDARRVQRDAAGAQGKRLRARLDPLGRDATGGAAPGRAPR